MGYWEASQPPRHSTHHHRRHNQSRDEKISHEISYNRSRLKQPRKPHNINSTLVESTGASQPQTRYGIVQNWLEQTARQTPHPWPSTSRGHRKENVGRSCPSEPLDTTSPYNKHPRLVDPGWDPRRALSNNNLHQSGSPVQVLDHGDPSKSTRRRATPSDSSFISGFENSTKPPDYGPRSIPQDCDSIPSNRPLEETGLAPLDASSTTSHVDEQLGFEKRPRRKTREDRYETKKKKRKHEREDAIRHGDHREKKRKKAEKRKSTISSKNVMGNFSSDAVLNNRITVQPHLKPGLFDNRRTSKKQPIADLTFSEMQFLKHQKQNPRPKPLSRSRIRERRREDREMEEVSSFFLPHRTDSNTHELRPHSPSICERHRRLEHRGRQFAPAGDEDLPGPLTSSHPPYSQYNQVSRISHHEPIETHSLDMPGSLDDGNESGKNTTYFTWSSSRHSPQANMRRNSPSPKRSESVWTATPEEVRRDLIATGIYRDTGIPFYDDCLTEQSNEGKQIEMRTPNVRRALHNQPQSPQQVRYRDQAVMTDDPPNHLKSNNVQTIGDSQAPKIQGNSRSQTPRVIQEIDRQRIAREVRLSPIERSTSKQDNPTQSVLGAEAISGHQSPRLVETEMNQERYKWEASDRVSIASRDAMPPPPIPQSRNSFVAATHANAQPDILGQNIPSANKSTEALQIPHMVGYNARETQELPRSNTQTTPSSEPAISNRGPLSPFSAVSWLPQRTPSAQVIDKQSGVFRSSKTPSIYLNQYEGELNEGSYQTDSPKLPAPESMAEFIARIETESQSRPAPRDYDAPGSESGIQEITLEASPFDTELVREQPMVYNMGDGRLNLASDSYIPYPNPRSPTMDQQHGGKFYAEARYPQYGIDVPAGLTGAMEPLEDFEEEYPEMSNFWRPNQFSQF